jgi:hypothetical protein
MLTMTTAWITAGTAREAGVQSCAQHLAARTLLCRGACGIYDENDQLLASFAQLFFPGLPVEQARSQLL